jgi:hypothetical protein
LVLHSMRAFLINLTFTRHKYPLKYRYVYVKFIFICHSPNLSTCILLPMVAVCNCDSIFLKSS